MLTPDAYSTAAVVAVCAYYGAAWILMFRHPARRTLVPIYVPPEKLSPAKIRYLWKRTFDDRTFWAAVLNLVAEGLATMTSEDGGAMLHLTPAANLRVVVSDEESLLLRHLKSQGLRKGTRLSVLDARTQVTMSRMAVAMTSTFHCGDRLPGTESFYLGMWDGKPVEIMYHPEARQRY